MTRGQRWAVLLMFFGYLVTKGTIRTPLLVKHEPLTIVLAGVDDKGKDIKTELGRRWRPPRKNR